MSCEGEVEDDDFDVVNVYEDSDSSEPEGPSTVPTDVLLQGSGLMRVFIVSTAKASGGHRPSCTFEGEIFDICSSSTGGNYLQRVLQPSDDSTMLSLSLRYEPPSPKFSNRHPDSTSYRVKLLQGSQFVYLHRGLPKVCIVDRAARSLSWGQLQLVMRDRAQLDSVLAVLRHIVVQHAEVWAPPVSLLWLGKDAAQGDVAAASKAQPDAADRGAEPPPAPAAGPAAAAAPPPPVPPPPVNKAPARWSVWTALAQALFPSVLLSGGAPLGGAGVLYRATLLLGSATAVAAVLWRLRRRGA